MAASKVTRELISQINEYIRTDKLNKVVSKFLKDEPEVARAIINYQKKYLQMQAYLQKAYDKKDLAELEKVLKNI